MAHAVLQAEHVTKRFGGLSALDDVDLALAEGELVAVIGPNGAGKTTLVGVLAGSLDADAGEIRFAGDVVTDWPVDRRASAGIVRSFQIASVFPELTTLENVALAAQARAGHSFRFWRPVSNEAGIRRQAMTQLEALGLADRAERAAQRLSHGERRLLEIAMALVTRPRVLLLDEPMAGLGVEEAREMVAFIGRLKGRCGIVLIEHDMDAVFALADRVMVMAAGRVVACGAPDAIRRDPVVQAAYLGDEDER